MPGHACWRSSARYSAALSMKTCGCQPWAARCSIPTVSPSSKVGPKAPTGAAMQPSRCPSTTAPCCCCWRPFSNSKAARCPIARWTSNRSATCMKVCSSAPSSAPMRSRWNWMPPRAPRRLGSSWPNWIQRAWMVWRIWPSCCKSAPAVLPAGCVMIWPNLSMTPWRIDC